MRQRVEDLGRISVLIENLLHHDLFDNRSCRNKDFVDWFNERTQDEKDDIIHSMVYGISHVKDLLCDISSIADGTDVLNETEHG